MSDYEVCVETHAVRGPVDRGALLDFREAITRREPLTTCELDDFLDPSQLHVHFDEGVGEADSGRFDVAWTTQDDYNVHYTDDTHRNLRWDVHPHDYPKPPADKHFHPPPDASSDSGLVEDSCIEVSEIVLVALATLQLWRTAYQRGSFDGINQIINPP